jgi:DNA (cytosine-5)-methyltransferase 1
MTLGSLFSGIGGFDLGLERAGFREQWQVEIDPWCRSVLAKHWPDVARYDDVRTVGHELERVDCICGEFPCQPVSVAGLQRGEDDDRWLWPEFARIVRTLRPRVVIVENVPGLFVRDFGRVVGDLAALGYDAEWDCIPAAALGARHRRDRVFVAYASESGLPLSERARVFGPRRREEGRAIAQCGWWAAEPDVGRVAYGVPRRVDRLKGLGNAVVPQVAEFVGRRVLEVLRGRGAGTSAGP